MINKINIGKIIKKLREENKLTQEELAEKIDISTNYLSRVERGLNVLNVETFLKMAEILSFSLEDFGVNIKPTKKINNTKLILITKILSESENTTKQYLKAIELVDEIKNNL